MQARAIASENVAAHRITPSGEATTSIVNTLAATGYLARLSHQGGVLSVAFSPDGRTLATAGDDQAIELYRCEPGPKLACPITAMGGADDPRASIDDLRGWRDHTTGAFDLRVFPGGHFYLADQAASVLDVVRHRLAVVGAGS